MKTTLGVFAALLLAGATYMQPAHAQTAAQTQQYGAIGQDQSQPYGATGQTQSTPPAPSFGSTAGQPGPQPAQAQLPQGSYRSS